ncbi:MAG: TonB-dependent receptor [Marinilabiliaceae bacterium]|nr:TonB-dependent receptor [Marinilabiliaceae bacterium]
MRKFLFTFILLGYLSVLNAQVVQVTDKNSAQPLELVTIFSQSHLVNTVTNSKGTANLSEFRGLDEIIFRLVGYETTIFSYSELEQLNFKVSMEQSELSLDEVVISVTRWKQGKRETSAKIATLRPKDIAFLNPQTAADLVGMTGDVYIQKSQMGGGSPMIRGFATNRVLIAVDGVRMNNAIFRSGNIQNIISLDPFATDRSEVIFGPGSVIYGSDAIGGVMGFYTLHPELSNDDQSLVKVNAVTRYASANTEKTGHVDVNLGFDKWASVTSFSFSDYDDLKMGSHGPDDYLRHQYVDRLNGQDVIVENEDAKLQVPTGYDQMSLMQKLRYSPNDNWDVNYGFHYSTTSDYDRYDRLTQPKGDGFKSAEWYYGPQVWMMNTVSLQHKASNQLFDHVNIIAAHQLFEESRHDRKFGKEDLRHRYEKVNALSLNVDFERQWKGGTRMFYGVELISNKINSTGEKENINSGETEETASRYPDDSRWHSIAAYANVLHKINPKMNLQGGLRYNQIILKADIDDQFYPFPFEDADINTGALTGSLGLVFNPCESWQLSTSASTGFRAPNIDDVGKVFDSEPGAVVVPNPDLEPEYAINWEMGAAFIVAKRLKLDAAVYYTYLTNAMVRRDFSLNGDDTIEYDGETSRVQAMQNAAHAYVYGIQCGMELKLPAGFAVSSRFNYQKGEEEQDDGSYSPLRHAAPWFGTTHLSYTTKRLKIDLNSQYNGKMSYANMPVSEHGKSYMYALDENDNVYSPAWQTLNIKAQYKVNTMLLITAGVDNITDERYKPYSSGIAAPGRNFIASLRVTL